MVLTGHQSSLNTNQISIGPYFLEIKEEKVVADARKKHKFSQKTLSNLWSLI